MNLDHLLTGRRNQQSPPLPHAERLPNPFLGGGGGGGGGGETSRRTAGLGAMASKQQQSQKASTIPGTGTTAQADQQPQPQEQPDDSMSELSKLLGLYDSEYDQARRHLGGHGEEASRKEAPRKVVRKVRPYRNEGLCIMTHQFEYEFLPPAGISDFVVFFANTQNNRMHPYFPQRRCPPPWETSKR